jgi:hypothetical protein
MADNIVKIHFKPDGDKGLVKAIQALDKETKKLLNTQAKIIDSNKKHTVSQKKGKTQAEKNAIYLDKLRIKLTALGFDYNKVVASNKHFGSALAGNRVALEKVTLATKKYIAEQTKADISTRILGGSFAVLRSQLLLFNFAMALGVRQLGRLVGESARVRGMETAFNTLSGATENSSIALRKLREATDNTMSSFDLFQQANNAMILGVSKNSNEMAEMFDIAQRLGRALGRDTASSVESLITGIGRQSRLMLDNIGIIVKSEEAYQAFAKANKTTVDALTDVQKKQAFLEATMDSARKKVQTLGTETLNTRDSFDNLSSSSSDLANELGEALSPMFVSLSKNTSSVFSNLTQLLRIINHNTTATFKFVKAQEDAEAMIKELTKGTDLNIDSNKSLRSQLVEVGIQYMDNLGVTTKLSNMMHELKTTEEEYNKEVGKREKESSLKEKTKAEKKALEVIEQKKKAEQDAFMTATNAQAKRNFLIEQAKKQQEKAVKSEIKLSKEANNERKKAIDIEEKIANFRSSKGLEKFKASEEAKNAVLKTTAEKRLSDLLKLEMQFFSSKSLTDEQMLEADMFFSEQRKQIFAEEMQARTAMANDQVGLALGAFNGLTGAMEQDFERRKQNELNALKDTNRYQKASAEERKNMEHEVAKGFAKEETRIFKMKRASNLAQIAMDTASAVVQALPNIPLSVLIGAMGLAQASIVASQPPPSYETGGLVGGNRHSQGGTIIEAERGEFVMSRNAVQSLGVETMNQINQGKNMPSVNISISAPLVDDSVVDSIIPAINKALRNGRANIGA